MDLKDIKSLVELLRKTDITELKIEREGSAVTIKREKVMVTEQVIAPVKPAEVVAVSAEGPADESNLVTVKSPIVGMFYTAAAPESPPFVKVGSRVNKGDVMCIIEAMKLMNEIECDTSGTVARMLVENGQPVEYGEPLYLIDPS